MKGSFSMRFAVAAVAAGLAVMLLALNASAGPPWGPETPAFNLEVILRDVSGGDGFGHVKFRQPNDDARVIYLDTWVRGLQPNHDYLLQRQVDLDPDGDCADASLSPWLTLGEGFTARPVTTDARGTGSAAFFRDLDPPGPATGPPPGMPFDIHFRLLDAATLAPVLASGCYRFVVSL